ncbi:PDR/VanB family oxidoreductase [Bosea sp. NPDC003192]|uniref:PDR/VanB family oxidoreductase n=1 Tax=Bosea sp. NPDC003192 TaxID=3390551 RepID=UPI003CFF756B
MSRIPVRVSSIRREAVDIAGFTLEPLDGGMLPPVRPGAHIDVFIAPGLTRQYSLCDGPGPAHCYTIAVKREEASRGGSAAMHDLPEGRVIEIGPPRDNFPLVAVATRHLLFAGGIGITPLLSMARHLAVGDSQFTLHYFARSPEHAAFAGTLAALASKGEIELLYGLSGDHTAGALRQRLAAIESGTHVYLCGPPAFIAATQSIASELGWPGTAVHCEHFSACATSAAAGDRDFELVLASRPGVIEVGAGETIAEALRRHGIEPELSCEQGICGTCITRVLDGLPDHRDSYMTEQEQAAGDRICICVSRAASQRLVLDL